MSKLLILSIKSSLVLLTLLFTASHGQHATHCEAIRDDCSFYLCIETKLQCGPSGYPLASGYKYCDAFLQKASSFSEQGKNWTSEVRFCLQDSLVKSSMTLTLSNVVYDVNNYTCQQFERIGYDSHIPCYNKVTPSICSLTKEDASNFLVILYKEIFNGESWKVGWSQAKRCTKAVYAAMVEKIVDRVKWLAG